MFAVVKLDQEYPVGTCVVSQPNNTWGLGGGNLFGVVESACEVDGNTVWARVRLAGEALALADVDIPIQGGSLSVNPLTGRVYVGDAQDSCGLISPRSRGELAVSAGSLVYIYIR